MIQLESLKLQNFRGFDKLKIDGFSKINVLLGENNSGKTSVLESIFLLSGMSNPQLALNINSMRGIPLNKRVLKYIFYNLDLSNKSIISGDFSRDTNRKVEISPVFEKNVVSRDIDTSAQENLSSAVSVVSTPDILGLDYSFTLKKVHEQTKNFKTLLRFEKEGVKQFLSSNYKEDILSTFLSSGNVDTGLSDRLKTLFVAKKEHIVNDLLSKFDPKIKGLNLVGNDIYIDKEGISERIPLKLMGDGVRHFLNITATIAASNEQNFIYLIDEIENGLHYKSQELMWQTLFSLTRNANIQLFITTHSLEMLQSMTNVLKQSENVDMQDNVKVISIVNTLIEGFQSYSRSFEGLDLSLENEMEIR
ncbi:ATP/GTP phosphatase [Clostridia bacterium]|nr:ATP/GTP phosphatase [Clostridia bacterium]